MHVGAPSAAAFAPSVYQEPLFRLVAADGSPFPPLPTAVDWDGVARQARLHRLEPLLYAALRDEDCLPSDIEAEWREAYLTTALRNAVALRALDAVVARLADAGIPVIVLKGAALAQTVYGNVALRPMHDLDVLVHPAHAARALQALASLGFRRLWDEPRHGAEAAYESHTSLINSAEMGVILELHWGLIDSPYYQSRLRTDWFWATARPLRAGQSQPLILGASAQILYLCAHLLLHHSGAPDGHLLWLNDIAACVSHDGDAIDWDAILAQAQRDDLVIALQRTLPRIATEFGAPVPPAALTRLAALRPTRAERRIVARLTLAHRPVGQRFWDDLTTFSDWPRRIGFATANLFPSQAYMRWRYGIAHPALTPLYYPYRWWLGLRSLTEPSAPPVSDAEEAR